MLGLGVYGFRVGGLESPCCRLTMFMASCMIACGAVRIVHGSSKPQQPGPLTVIAISTTMAVGIVRIRAVVAVNPKPKTLNPKL